MTTGELIKELCKFDKNAPVVIHIPIRRDKYQTAFVADLRQVIDWERNDASDCPQLVTDYWYKAVGESKKPVEEYPESEK